MGRLHQLAGLLGERRHRGVAAAAMAVQQLGLAADARGREGAYERLILPSSVNPAVVECQSHHALLCESLVALAG